MPQSSHELPQAVAAVVCSNCKENWDDHVMYAQRESGDETYLVTIATCYTVLKQKNRGPVGPVGPMGAQGNPGGM